MKNTQKGSMAVVVLLVIIVLLVVVFGIYIYSQNNNQIAPQVNNSQTTTQNTQPITTQNNPVVQPTTQSIGATDKDIAAVVFPSSQWSQHSETVPGNKTAVVYRPLGQTGLPILVINSIHRSNDGNDALVTVVFYGADSATEVKFVHNLKSQPIELNIPDQSPFGPVKTSVSNSGFNPTNNFFVTYNDVGGDVQTVNYQVNGGLIIETGKSPITKN